MTDAHVTFSTPENVANAASLYIADGSKTLVYQIVNTTTFQAGISLGSGIKSNGNLTVTWLSLIFFIIKSLFFRPDFLKFKYHF